MNGLLEAAQRYAELGYPVFPCVPGRKTPLTRNGFRDASTDAEQIEAWWQRYPNANIAIPTAGLVVIDVDGPENGWLADQPERLAELASGCLAITPGGGKHYYFRSPDGIAIRCQTGLAPKVDVRADGGYVLAPPSIVGGKAYHWLEGLELVQPPDRQKILPGWLEKGGLMHAKIREWIEGRGFSPDNLSEQQINSLQDQAIHGHADIKMSLLLGAPWHRRSGIASGLVCESSRPGDEPVADWSNAEAPGRRFAASARG